MTLQVMEVQRRRCSEGASMYSVKYHYPLTKGVLNRARRVDRMIARADSVVQTFLISLLKVPCNTLQYAATYCNTLQHTATIARANSAVQTFLINLLKVYCITLQHAATRCNNR